MGKSVCIIGGGIIGLMNAWHLARHGHEVTLIDEGRIEDNTSFGNAGLVSPFEKEPLSHPGVILSTFGLMLRGRSPLIIPPGSVDPRLLLWLRAQPPLREIAHEKIRVRVLRQIPQMPAGGAHGNRPRQDAADVLRNGAGLGRGFHQYESFHLSPPFDARGKGSPSSAC